MDFPIGEIIVRLSYYITLCIVVNIKKWKEDKVEVNETLKKTQITANKHTLRYNE